MFTELIGWIGVGVGVCVSFPQLAKSIQGRSTRGLSKQSYQLLFLTIACYLIRSIAIREFVFIVSNSLGLVITSAMLYLFKRYPETY